jgi:hypothetical protein
MGTAAICRDDATRLAEVALALIFDATLTVLLCTAATRLVVVAFFDAVVAMTGIDNTTPIKAAVVSEMSRWAREETTKEEKVEFKRITSFCSIQFEYRFEFNQIKKVTQEQ